jgi:uncharacterized membrane protein HdeD (DUF308 family)
MAARARRLLYEAMLGRVLIARGAINEIFGLYFLLVAASAPGDTLRHAGYYLAVDGILALAMAVALLRQHAGASLAGVALGSALARLLLALWFLLVPQLTTRALSSVLALLLLSVGALTLGAAEIALAFTRGRRRPVSGELLAAGGLSIVAAVAAYQAFPDAGGLRLVFAAYALAHGALLLVAGVRRVRSSPAEVTSPPKRVGEEPPWA